MNLLDILDLDLIDLDMDATDKDGVLKQLSSMLYKKGNIKDLDKFLEAVYERESIGETGLGGIAIPHGLTDQVINASVAIGKVKQPVEWESLDDQPPSRADDSDPAQDNPYPLGNGSKQPDQYGAQNHHSRYTRLAAAPTLPCHRLDSP